VGAVAKDIRERLADVAFPLEYHAEVLEETAGGELGVVRVTAIAVGAAIAGFLLLQAAFGSWRLAIAACLALPVALVGGLLAALMLEGELSLGSLLGLLALFALAVRIAVLLVARTRDAEPGAEARLEAVVRAARERLGPVLATAAVYVVWTRVVIARRRLASDARKPLRQRSDESLETPPVPVRNTARLVHPSDAGSCTPNRNRPRSSRRGRDPNASAGATYLQSSTREVGNAQNHFRRHWGDRRRSVGGGVDGHCHTTT
jgi:hypothetical protein